MKKEKSSGEKIYRLLSLLILVVICLCLAVFFITNYNDIMILLYGSPKSTNGNASPGSVYAKDFVEIVKDEWSCSHDSIGNMIIEGKVRNTSSTSVLQFVKLRGSVLTETGEVVNTNTGFIDSDVLYANAESTFKIYVDDPNNIGTQCKIRVEDASFK
jgi:hypothetical protein